MKVNRLKQAIPLKFTEEVADAINERRAVVALESNVITHGLVYPDNALTAFNVEKAVRKGGAVPATIGIEKGQILIGMNHVDIECFAQSKSIPKVGNRDISVALAGGGRGATTVASSIIAAELANIDFFASAGIGGVHRGAEKSMDISGDLIQFTRSKIAVVCAGAKNILDLSLTMEFLETFGVPVISYQFDFFPAFYCKSSNIKSPHRIDNIDNMVMAIRNHLTLKGDTSILVTKPIEDKFAIEEQEVEEIIERAIRNAENENVRGNSITKYLMHAIDKETKGRTSTANSAVLVSTAEFAGKIAAEYVKNLKEKVL